MGREARAGLTGECQEGICLGAEAGWSRAKGIRDAGSGVLALRENPPAAWAGSATAGSPLMNILR